MQDSETAGSDKNVLLTTLEGKRLVAERQNNVFSSALLLDNSSVNLPNC